MDDFKEPEFIIATRDAPNPRVVPFSMLFAERSNITQMTMLWDYNAYHVDVTNKTMIINGGRKIDLNVKFKGEVGILYARRNQRHLSVDSGEKVGGSVSYLLGLEELTGDKNEIMVHISPDGSEWYWRNNR